MQQPIYWARDTELSHNDVNCISHFWRLIVLLDLLCLVWRLIFSSTLETRSLPCAAPRFRPVSWIGVSALQMRIVDLTEPRFLTTTSTTTTTTATTTTTTNTTTSTQLLLTSSCDYDDAHPLSFWILLLFVFLFLFLLLTLFFLFLPCSRSGC